MSETFNIYCDESCHLEHDDSSIMVLGAVWCKSDQTKKVSDRVRDLKRHYGLMKKADAPNPSDRDVEIKWTKISTNKAELYTSLVDYFFDDDDLHFRGIIIDKTILDHKMHDQTHDDWYYKMLFTLLEPIIDPQHFYRIYLDIKDTRSEERRARLERYLRTSRHDYSGTIIQRVQQIRSGESQVMQLADVLMGAVAFHNRVKAGDFLDGSEMDRSRAKVRVVERIQKRARKTLTFSTWLREPKFNLLRWEPRPGNQ